MEKLRKTSGNRVRNANAIAETTQSSLFQVAEISIAYRPNFKASERPKVTSSQQVYDIFKENWDENLIELQEQFKVMLLNRANRVIGIYEVSNGGMTGTIADPKLIFSAALKACACGIVLAHNHPSGNLIASQSDVHLTSKIKAGGKLLDIEVLDHVIITTDGYFSLSDEGLF